MGPRSTCLTWEGSFQPAGNVGPEFIRDDLTAAHESIIQALQHELVEGPPLRPLWLSVTKTELNTGMTGGHLLIYMAGWNCTVSA